MVVNVCPAAVTKASPDQVWSTLVRPERLAEWIDADYLSAEPPGDMQAGQTIHLSTRAFGRRWPVTIAVRGLDPQRRWLDLWVSLPLGVANEEHITLADAAKGGTLVRLN